MQELWDLTNYSRMQRKILNFLDFFYFSGGGLQGIIRIINSYNSAV